MSSMLLLTTLMACAVFQTEAWNYFSFTYVNPSNAADVREFNFPFASQSDANSMEPLQFYSDCTTSSLVKCEMKFYIADNGDYVAVFNGRNNTITNNSALTFASSCGGTAFSNVIVKSEVDPKVTGVVVVEAYKNGMTTAQPYPPTNFAQSVNQVSCAQQNNDDYIAFRNMGVRQIQPWTCPALYSAVFVYWRPTTNVYCGGTDGTTLYDADTDSAIGTKSMLLNITASGLTWETALTTNSSCTTWNPVHPTIFTAALRTYSAKISCRAAASCIGISCESGKICQSGQCIDKNCGNGGNGGSAVTCASGYVAKASSTACTNCSTATCCEQQNCGNGNSGSAVSCPTGYVAKALSTTCSTCNTYFCCDVNGAHTIQAGIGIMNVILVAVLALGNIFVH